MQLSPESQVPKEPQPGFCLGNRVFEGRKNPVSKAETGLATSRRPSMQVRVDLGERAYDIQVAASGTTGLGEFVRQRCPGDKALIVTDEHVGPCHAPPVIRS